MKQEIKEGNKMRKNTTIKQWFRRNFGIPIKQWFRRNFGIHMWFEAKGQGGRKLLRVVVNGNTVRYEWEDIPNRNIYHISYAWFGKCHTIEISERLYERLAKTRLYLH